MIIRILFLLLFFTSTAFAGPEVSGGSFDPTSPGNIGGKTPGAGRFGDSTNYFDINSQGYATLHGDARAYITRRPKVDIVHQVSHAVPDEVQRGVFFGYSMPVYNSDDEELFFKSYVPYRYDGESDPSFHIFCYLAGGEDVGDYFKFQLSWEGSAHSEIIVSNSTHDTTVEQAVLTGRNAQYSLYDLVFTLDHDIGGAGSELAGGSILGARLRRVDATNPDVDNEIVVVDWKIKYRINKLYGIW